MNTLPAATTQQAVSRQPGLRPAISTSVARGGAEGLPVPHTPPPTAGALFNALRRRWLLALLLAIPAAALAALAAWFILPPVYTAQTLLHLAATAPRGVFIDASNTSEIGAFQRTTLTSIKTRPVLTTAIKQLEAEGKLPQGDLEERLAWLEKNLQGDYTQGPEILRLTLKGGQPKELADILNAVTQVYLEQVHDQDNSRRTTRLKQLEDTHKKHETDLRLKQRELAELEKKFGVTDPQTLTFSYQAALQGLTAAETKLQEAQVNLKKAQIEIAGLKTQSKQMPKVTVPTLSVEEALAKDPVAERMLVRLAEVQDEIDKTLAVAAKGTDEPSLQPLIKQREQIEQSLKGRREEIRGRIEAQLQAKVLEELEVKIAGVDNQLNVHREEEKLLQREVDERKAAVAHLRDKPAAEWENLRSEVARAEQTLQRVGSEVEALKMEPPLQSRVSLLEPAETPRTSNQDKALRVVALAGVGAFALVLMGVSYFEYRARRISCPDEISHGVGMSILGTIPSVPNGARRTLVPPKDGKDRTWHTLLTESIDATRAMLLHAAQTEGVRTVMISSAVAGEGKTSLSCQLGASLARAGQRTLLVDFDLRKPTLHRLFGQPLGPGVREIMRAESHVSEACRGTKIEGLWLLPAGQSGSTSALTQEGVQLVFEQLKGEFDFIIVDTSPVLPVADALTIGQHVDGVLFAILREVSRVPLVTLACQRLERLGIRLLGAVFVGARGDAYGHSYQYTANAVN